MLYTLHSTVRNVDKIIIPKGLRQFELNTKSKDVNISRRQVDDPECTVEWIAVFDDKSNDDYVTNFTNHSIISPTIIVHGTQSIVVNSGTAAERKELNLGVHVRRHPSAVCSIMTSAIMRNGCLHIEYGKGPIHSGYMQSDMASVYQTVIPKLFSDTFDILRPNPIAGWTFNSGFREWETKHRTIAESGHNYIYTSGLPPPISIEVDSKCAHTFPMLLDPTFASRVITLYMDWYNKIVRSQISVVVDNKKLPIEDIIAINEKGKYYSCSRMLLLATIVNCSTGMIDFQIDINDPLKSEVNLFEGLQTPHLNTDGTGLWATVH